MKNAAYIIGQTYRDSAEFRPLLGVDNDLSDMHGFLQHVAGYDIVHLVRDQDKSEVLRGLADLLSMTSPGDRVLIYFSGHGHGVRGEHVLVCRRAKRRTLEYFDEAIPVNHIRRETDGLGLELAMVVDSCWDNPYVAGHKGAPPRLSAEQAQYLKDIGTAPPTPTASGVTGSFSLLCGCGQDQVAIEVPQLRRGLFTAAFMAVMKSAAQSRREVRLSDDLRDEVANQMRLLGETHRLTEIPTPFKSGGTPVILEGRRTEAARHAQPQFAPLTSPSHAPKASPSPADPTPSFAVILQRVKQADSAWLRKRLKRLDYLVSSRNWASARDLCDKVLVAAPGEVELQALREHIERRLPEYVESKARRRRWTVNLAWLVCFIALVFFVRHRWGWPTQLLPFIDLRSIWHVAVRTPPTNWGWAMEVVGLVFFAASMYFVIVRVRNKVPQTPRRSWRSPVTACVTYVIAAGLFSGASIVPDETFLDACKSGTPEQVSSMIEAGADLNATQDSYSRGKMRLIDAALVDAACDNSNPGVIVVLIKAGANPNVSDNAGKTPLLQAAHHSNPGVITALIKAGADPNVSDEVGETPLLGAAYNSNPGILAALVKAGADVNYALILAERPNPKAIAALIGAGADPNVKDSLGRTPLMNAAIYPRELDPDVFAALLKAGANTALKDLDGKTAFEFARAKDPSATAVLTMLAEGK